MNNVEINLAEFQSKLIFRKEQGKRYIFCCIRQKYMVLTPEEIVRQLILWYLMENRNYPKNRIAVEKQLDINGRKKRFDILILNKAVEPMVLVECKAPNVPITQAAFNQVVQYNSILKTDLLIVSNGESTFCCTINSAAKAFSFLEEIPSYEV